MENLKAFIGNPINKTIIDEFKYDERLAKAEKELAYFKSEDYLDSLVGTIGAEAIAVK